MRRQTPTPLTSEIAQVGRPLFPEEEEKEKLYRQMALSSRLCKAHSRGPKVACFTGVATSQQRFRLVHDDLL